MASGRSNCGKRDRNNERSAPRNNADQPTTVWNDPSILYADRLQQFLDNVAGQETGPFGQSFKHDCAESGAGGRNAVDVEDEERFLYGDDALNDDVAETNGSRGARREPPATVADDGDDAGQNYDATIENILKSIGFNVDLTTQIAMETAKNVGLAPMSSAQRNARLYAQSTNAPPSDFFANRDAKVGGGVGGPAKKVNSALEVVHESYEERARKYREEQARQFAATADEAIAARKDVVRRSPATKKSSLEFLQSSYDYGELATRDDAEKKDSDRKEIDRERYERSRERSNERSSKRSNERSLTRDVPRTQSPIVLRRIVTSPPKQDVVPKKDAKLYEDFSDSDDSLSGSRSTVEKESKKAVAEPMRTNAACVATESNVETEELPGGLPCSSEILKTINDEWASSTQEFFRNMMETGFGQGKEERKSADTGARHGKEEQASGGKGREERGSVEKTGTGRASGETESRRVKLIPDARKKGNPEKTSDGSSLPHRPPSRWDTPEKDDAKGRVPEKKKDVVRDVLPDSSKERATKIAGLNKELERLRQEQKELMRRKQRSKYGHNDPEILENAKWQEDVLGKIGRLGRGDDDDGESRVNGATMMTRADDDGVQTKRSNKTKSGGEPGGPEVAKKTVKDTEKEEDPKREEKKQKKFVVNYEYFDGGNHWCRSCNCLFTNVQEMCQHLHSNRHRQNLDPNHRPWMREGSAISNDSKAKKNTVTITLKGVEFLMPAQAYFCSLCSEFSGDIPSAEQHLRSDEHNKQYEIFLENDALYEHHYNVDKETALSFLSKTDIENQRKFGIKRQAASNKDENAEKVKKRKASPPSDPPTQTQQQPMNAEKAKKRKAASPPSDPPTQQQPTNAEKAVRCETKKEDVVKAEETKSGEAKRSYDLNSAPAPQPPGVPNQIPKKPSFIGKLPRLKAGVGGGTKNLPAPPPLPKDSDKRLEAPPLPRSDSIARQIQRLNEECGPYAAIGGDGSSAKEKRRKVYTAEVCPPSAGSVQNAPPSSSTLVGKECGPYYPPVGGDAGSAKEKPKKVYTAAVCPSPGNVKNAPSSSGSESRDVSQKRKSEGEGSTVVAPPSKTTESSVADDDAEMMFGDDFEVLDECDAE